MYINLDVFFMQTQSHAQVTALIPSFSTHRWLGTYLYQVSLSPKVIFMAAVSYKTTQQPSIYLSTFIAV